jgi:hypothetical protein
LTTRSTIEPCKPSSFQQNEEVKKGSYGSMVTSASTGGTPLGSRAVTDTVARARALGIPGGLGDRFTCIIPGHDHTARLEVDTRSRVWRYRCEGDTRRPLPGLAEIRGFIAYGELRWMQPVEIARWRDLLDYEAGLSDREPITVHLPPGASANARVVTGSIGKLVGLRDPAKWPDDRDLFTFSRGIEEKGEPFTPGFGCAYSGLGNTALRRAIAEIERLGIIERTPGQQRRQPILWRLTVGVGGPVPTDSVERTPDRIAGDAGKSLVPAVEPHGELADDDRVAGTQPVCLNVGHAFDATERHATGIRCDQDNPTHIEHQPEATPSVPYLPSKARVKVMWSMMSPAVRDRAWGLLSGNQRADVIAAVFDASDVIPLDSR